MQHEFVIDQREPDALQIFVMAAHIAILRVIEEVVTVLAG
jgi:hypothetical protein